jgi:hypothetical protein
VSIIPWKISQTLTAPSGHFRTALKRSRTLYTWPDTLRRILPNTYREIYADSMKNRMLNQIYLIASTLMFDLSRCACVVEKIFSARCYECCRHTSQFAT